MKNILYRILILAIVAGAAIQQGCDGDPELVEPLMPEDTSTIAPILLSLIYLINYYAVTAGTVICVVSVINPKASFKENLNLNTVPTTNV